MKTLSQLKLAADQRRSAFFADLGDVKTQLRPDYIFNEALHSVDPDFHILKRMEDRVKSNPFAALAAFGGLFLLARQLTSKTAKHPPLTPKSGKRSRFARSTSKGDHHGDIDSAKHI